MNFRNYIYALLICLVITACQFEAEEVPEVTIDEQAVLVLFQQWNESLQTGDPHAVAANYAENGVLLPTLSNRVRTGHDEIADYFEHFLEYSPSGVIDEHHIRIYNTIVVNSGIYTFTLTGEDGETSDVPARFTFVYVFTDGEWKILEHHSSAMPE